MDCALNTFLKILLVGLIMFSLVWFTFAQAGKDEGYRPTRDQILHICETVPSNEMPDCLDAANNARK